MIRIEDFEPEGVVIDAGLFPTTPMPLSMLERCDRIVCCDGAANRYLASGGRVWRIVGDCDSIAGEIRERYADILRPNPDQETNDQTKAVDYLERHGVKRIAILGATGLREDHTLGNISLLTDYHRRGLDVRIYTDYGVFLPFDDSLIVKCCAGAQVSLFNFGAKDVKGYGLEYPLRDFGNWWEGTLNECSGGVFGVTCRGTMLAFVTYGGK